MNKKYSQCCGYLALKRLGEETYFCGNCKKDCETRPYSESWKIEELLTEIRDILLNIQNKL